MNGPQLSNLLQQALWETTWQSALLAAIVLGLLGLAGRWITPFWRSLLLAIPIARLAMLVVPVSGLSLFQFFPETQPEPTTRQAASVVQPLLLSNAAASAVTPMLDSDRSPTSVSVSTQRVGVVECLLSLWILGTALLLCRWWVSAFRLRRWIRSCEVVRDDTELAWILESCCLRAGLWRRVSCVLSHEQVGPATCGLFRPTIVIPCQLTQTLTQDELQMVMAHEVAHIRRFDTVLMNLGRWTRAMHWFNPLAHMLVGRLHREMELAVDASTLGQLGRQQASAYGALLLRIASLMQPHAGLVPMATGSGSKLRRRIDQVATWRRPRKWQVAIGALAAGLLAITGLSDAPAEPIESQASPAAVDDSANPSNTAVDQESAERQVEEDAQGETVEIQGRVVDADGLPVEGAFLSCDVFLKDKRQTVSTTSGPGGHFTMAYPRHRHPYEMLHTWVYAKGHGVRVVMMTARLRDKRAEVQLPRLESRAFRILLPTGEPCVGAKVRPRYVFVPNGVYSADENTGLSNFVVNELKDKLTGTTDADGNVTIEGIPLALFHSVEVETEGYGLQHFRNLQVQDGTLTLAEVGSIDGVIRFASPEDLEGTSIRVSTKNHTTTEIEGIAHVKVDRSGRFRVPAIASGQISPRDVSLPWNSELKVQPVVIGEPPHMINRVLAGKSLELVIEARSTVVVRGRIVAQDTGKPVSGVRISARHRHQPQIRRDLVADEQGEYSFRIPTGPVSLNVQIISFGSREVAMKYQFPPTATIQIPADAGESFSLDDIHLKPKRQIKGTLTSSDGKPIEGASVVLHKGTYRHHVGRTVTKTGGSFEMSIDDWRSAQAKSRSYWAQIDRPATPTDPPELTKLIVLDDNPESMRLRRP